MRIIVYQDECTGEVWYYIFEGKGEPPPLIPFYIKDDPSVEPKEREPS